jgi:hypothetical protein
MITFAYPVSPEINVWRGFCLKVKGFMTDTKVNYESIPMNACL